MARSSLTLAAAVSAAVPDVRVVGTSLLPQGPSGRFDTAIVDGDDGKRLVIRAATSDAASADLRDQGRALRALSSGTRSLLPFGAPTVRGETLLDGQRALVVDYLSGFVSDGVELGQRPDLAAACGTALAQVHNLPVSLARTEGLADRAPHLVRQETHYLVERAETTGKIPPPLQRRWRDALNSDQLWSFASRVILGGIKAEDFLFTESSHGIVVGGILDWSGLSTGDPAQDFSWVYSTPGATDSVFQSYLAHLHGSADVLIRQRARLHAELEFARWLVYGDDTGRAEIVADAVGLLDSLAYSVGQTDLVPAEFGSMNTAMTALASVPPVDESRIDSSAHALQTDVVAPAHTDSPDSEQQHSDHTPGVPRSGDSDQ